MNTPDLPAVPYALVDCDNHYYEDDDCFTRHIESRWRERTVWVDRSRADGIGVMRLGDERLSFFSAAVGDHVGAPGAMREFFRGRTDAGGAVNMNPIRASEHPEFTTREPRLQQMDRQGLEAAVMLPTLGVGVEYQLRRHAELLYPSLRAFNRWVAEAWGYGGDGRVFGVAVLSLADVDQAVAELERLIDEGVRLVHITAGPIDGHSPADRRYDPVWARLQEAGIPLALHIGETGMNDIYASAWGEPAMPPSHRYTAFNTLVGIGERSISDTVASMVFLNLFGRFPGLRVMVIEFGSAWLPSLLKTMDKIHRMGDHKSRWRYERPELPSAVVRRHFWVVPFHEDDVERLIASIGVEHVINGSDYPHPEGLAWPVQMVENMAAATPETVRRVMRDNACELLGLAA